MPPVTGQAVSPSPFGALAGPDAGGASDMQQQLQDLMGQLRDLANQANAVVEANPALAQEGQQITALIKQMIVKSAKAAPAQGMSAADVPPSM